MKTDLPKQKYFPFIRYAICRCDADTLAKNGKKLFINTTKAFPVKLSQASIFDSYEKAEAYRGNDEMVIPVYRA